MKEFLVTINDGVYTCDTGMTADMWKDILTNSELTQPRHKDILVKFYNEPGHQSTYAAMAEKYNPKESKTPKTPQYYYGLQINWCTSICKKYGIAIKQADNSGDATLLLVAMTGKELKGGPFEWKLRPELLQAMEELKVPCPNLGSLVQRINNSLTDFTDTFRYKRKELTKLGKTSKAGILYKYDDPARDWAINEGGGTEVQYHIYLRGNEVGYGLGLNTQYVPFANSNTPVGYMQPYADAYLRIKDKFPATLLKACGFAWLDGDESDLHHLENDCYYLLGKTIPIAHNEMKWTDYQTMLSHIRGGLFELYQNIFEYKQQTNMKKNAVMDALAPICKLLQTKRNIILQGAPGTGKTYTTAAIAVRMCSKDFKDFDDRSKVMAEYDRLYELGQISFCTFHQSMDYEDFVEGLKPEVKGNSVAYNIESGIFKTICERAQTKNDKSYVLIIDEINRGNISKIFGELITLLEADKRTDNGSPNIRLKLPYSKEDFAVPANLYIIGTMNTTDRSTGTIDYAVRRRFAFVTLESSAAVIEEWYKTQAVADEVKKAALSLFAEINGTPGEDKHAFIASHKAGDFELEDLKVGHSYFMAKDLDALKLKMRYEVVPLIREYQKDGILRSEKDDNRFFDKWMNAECKGQSAASPDKE